MKYGFIKEAMGPLHDGAVIRYHTFNDDGTNFSFDNYYLSLETHKKAFALAGFVDFAWHTPCLDPDVANHEKDYWDAFMTYPPIIGFSARKPLTRLAVTD